jgi:replication-associated recombination protein RarA
MSSLTSLLFAYSQKWGSPGFRKTTLEQIIAPYVVLVHVDNFIE